MIIPLPNLLVARYLRVIVTLAMGVSLSTAAFAAGFPQKAVKIIVPYAAGGPADSFARLAAQQLAARWKVPVIVDNRAGATGIIGTQAVARASPDGYTLLLASGSNAISVTLDSGLPYDTLKDLVPVSGLVSTPYFLFANANFPANSVKELVALAKSEPEKISYGSAGNGGAPHLSGEMFGHFSGTRLLHVPYKGTAPATTAMLAGEVDLMFGSLASTYPYVKAKRLKILGAADAKRSELLPDVPTIAEAGVPGFEAANWFGLFAPAGSSSDVMQKIADTVRAAMSEPAIKSQLANMGATPMLLAPTDFGIYFQRQVELWASVITSRKLKR